MQKGPSKQVLWISHRGYKKSATENTKEAFEAAIQNGFRHIETDLRCTADGHIVLSHDKTLFRISKNPVDVETSTRAELEEVRLPFDGRPFFLDQLLDHYQHIHWSFDIKSTKNEKTTEAFIKLIQQRELVGWIEKNVSLISWNQEKENLLRHFFPRAKYYKLKAACWRAGLSSLFHIPLLGNIKSGQTYSLTPQIFGMNLFSQRIVNIYHKRNARLLAFLPKTEEETRRALLSGFDEILTDNLPIEL